MRKIKSFLILLVCALFLLCIPVQAAQDKNVETLNASGIALPISIFNELYGKPYSLPDSISVLEENATINLKSITLKNDTISFTALINYNDQAKELAARGRLYKSYKQRQNSINSIVGDLQDNNNNFEILLFEIYQDKAKDKMIVNPKLKESPHLKIYLKDQEDNILLFEFDLPKKLKNIVINHDDRIHTTKDFFWFINVIEPYELKKIPTDENIKQKLGITESNEFSTQAVGLFSDWTHSETYYASFYGGFDYYQCYSTPYGSWKAMHVKPESTWTVSFKIGEYTLVNGQLTRDVGNAFIYKNVKIATGVGAKSTIIRAYVDGRLANKSYGHSLYMKIFEKAWSLLLPKAPSISTIRSWINEVIDAGTKKEITLGTENIKLKSDPTVVEGANSLDHEMFRNTVYNGATTGHYMTLQTVVQYEDTENDGKSATANGMMKIKWDVYYGLEKYDADYKEITFTYTSSPQ